VILVESALLFNEIGKQSFTFF